MPWFPDFVNAVELARRETRSEGHADPVGSYFAALERGDTDTLETIWPGEVVVQDPRAGEIRGHRALRRFVHDNKQFLAERHARIERVAATCTGDRAAVELLAHLSDDAGREVAWPVSVVAESVTDRSVVLRTYCSQEPVDGRRHLRPPVLGAGGSPPDDVVGRFLAAVVAGDASGVVATFGPDGWLREPVGDDSTHRGRRELQEFFARTFSAGGGIGLQPCVVTDDGVRCAVEYNCVSWGGRDLPPQAGILVCERDPDGLLAAVRVYDDLVRPA